MRNFRENTRSRGTFIIGIVLFLTFILLGFSVLASGADVYPQERLSFRYDGKDTIVDIEHYYSFGGNEPVLTDRGARVTGDLIELEIDGVSTIIQVCRFECDGLTGISNCTVRDTGFITVSHNLGEITGTPPTVRARTSRTECQIEGFHRSWTTWSGYAEAVVPGPVPIVEIATMIGVGGIGVAVLNNYWSGRREKQMTEVTRTAAVDERFMELYDASRETEFQRTQAEVLYQYEWTNYDDFLSKYGPRTNVDAWAKIQSTTQYYEGIGVLVRTDSVSLDQVYQLLGTQIVDVWEKLGDIILERRKRELNPQIFSAFETLYYAIKNYSQQGPPPKDDVRVHKFED